MKKPRLAFAAMLAAFAVSLTACQAQSAQERVGEALGLDVSSGSEVFQEDTHSGNGDGTTCLALSFSDGSVQQEIQGNPAWQALPLDETTEILVYGKETGTTKTGPFLSDEDGNPLAPVIQNGYYCFIDRHTDTETGILERSSFNFTVGIYDTDTDTLYFYELDT